MSACPKVEPLAGKNTPLPIFSGGCLRFSFISAPKTGIDAPETLPPHNDMKTNFNSSRQRGFTLVELLVTISIVAILAASAYGAYGLLIEKFKKTEGVTYAKSIERAVIGFTGEYGDRFPLGETGGGEGDIEVTTESGSETIKILVGKDVEKNPRSSDFLGDMKQAKTDNSGKPKGGLIYENDQYGVVDPWGNYYKIKMDADFDKEIENPDIAGAGTKLKLRAKVLVWSPGADKNFDTWEDNVKSWD